MVELKIEASLIIACPSRAAERLWTYIRSPNPSPAPNIAPSVLQSLSIQVQTRVSVLSRASCRLRSSRRADI